MIQTRWSTVLMFTLVPAFLSAQVPDYTMHWGEFQRINHMPESLELAEIGSEGIYVVKSDRKGQQEIDMPWMIERYDKQTFRRTDSVFLNVREGAKKGRIEKVLTLNDQLYVFYSIKEKQKVTLFSRQLDKYMFRLENRSTRILEIAEPKGQRIRADRFRFALSPGGSKIFIVRNFSKDSAHHELTSFAMLDNELNLLWQKTVTLPYDEGLLKIQTLKVNDAGMAFALAVYKEPNQWNGVFELLIATGNGESVLRYTPQIRSGFISSLQIEVNGTENLLCAGFYSKTGGMGARGTYFANISLSRPRLPVAVVSDFEQRFALEDPHKRDVAALQARAELDGEAELDRYVVDRILMEKDGSMLLVAEQRYAYSISPPTASIRQPSFQRGSRIRSNQQLPSRNYRGDIVIVKLDSTGHKLWEKKIHKSQDTDNSHRLYTSYLLLNLRGKLGILFNDDQRNVKSYPALPKDFSGTRSILVMVHVNDAGEVAREWLFQSVNSDVAVSPSMCSQVSDRELILYGYHGIRQQFSRINFK